MWVPNNLIGFNQNNQPYFKNQGNNNNNVKKPLEIIDISHEFKETSASAVENSIQLEETSSVSAVVNPDENSVQFEETSVSAVESSDENSVQFEGTSSVIQIENLYSIKTKEKKNTWSINETRTLIGAIEARYTEKLDLYRQKLEIEKEKVKALGDLQNILKEKST